MIVRNQLLIVAYSPATNNDIKEISKFDIFLKQLLAKVDIGKENYHFTYFYKTKIHKGKILSQEEIKQCKKDLNDEVLNINPQVIIFLGKDIRDAYNIRWPDSITSKVFMGFLKTKHCKIYSLANPSILYYKPELEKEYKKKLKKIWKHYNPTLL